VLLGHVGDDDLQARRRELADGLLAESAGAADDEC
jgi:hypothetical protein